MNQLSQDQQTALDQILYWYRNSKKEKQYISLGGYAGTGKTTLIATVRKELHSIEPKLRVGFVSYTGKASRILRNKLNEQNTLRSTDTVSTIHSLIYSPVINDKEVIIGWQKKESIDSDLIIIDEASMVDRTIWTHLLSYGLPILVVGDHGQLPPIEGSFNLMSDPEIKLVTIHRQARDNPIIELSIQARQYGVVKCGSYGQAVKKYDAQSEEAQDVMQDLLGNYKEDTLVICGYNHTRNKLNKHIRQELGFETPEPTSGDRVICLRNSHKNKIFNGMLGQIISIQEERLGWRYAEIAMDDEETVFKGPILAKQFGAPSAINFTDSRAQTTMGELFDFGYAMTVHKAQGSQANRVILFEERFPKMTDDQWKRWLYTAITRAESELFIFGAAN